MKKFTKIALIVASFVLVAALSVGATIAWLTDSTATVTNTFAPAGIEITLNEADVYQNGESGQTAENLGQKKEPEARVEANEYQVIPGNTYFKDPTVTVKANSEKCWLFVEFTETNSPATYYTYTSTLTTANGWTQGQGTGEGKDGIPTNVWYRTVEESTADQPWVLLADIDTSDAVHHLSVKDTVSETNMNAAKAAKLEWKAYAVQYANLTNAADAWAQRPTT